MSLLQILPPPTHRLSLNPRFQFPSQKKSLSSSSFLSRRKPNSLRCSTSSFCQMHHGHEPKSDDIVELPLFPLPLVLFPGAILPIQVFEFRYRMMMHTLIETDLRFGVIYSDVADGPSDVGCVGEVVRHERLADDRFFLICKGQERFRVTSLVRTKPYLVAEVKWLEDRPLGDREENLEALAN